MIREDRKWWKDRGFQDQGPMAPWMWPTVDDVVHVTRLVWGLGGDQVHARSVRTLLADTVTMSELHAKDDGAGHDVNGHRLKRSLRPSLHNRSERREP